MRLAITAFLLCASATAFAQPAEEPEADSIVVTGQRIRDARDALEACLARNCPPNEDIDATLGLAELQFEAGEYEDARRTVRASVRRNREEAADYPEPVADLHRAGGRLARHMGLDDEARRAVQGILDSLQAGIPQEDHRHFGARLELADIHVAQGRYPSARRELERLAESARRAGREDVATIAEVRSLWISYLADPRGSARRELRELAASPDPVRATYAKLMLARIERERGDVAAADALLQEITRGRPSRRTLLHNPPYELAASELYGPGGEIVPTSGTARLSDNFDGQWIDVGFWIQPDGKVAELEILRKGGDPGWAAPLLESIRGRIYSRAAEPTYRLERYTYTAEFEQQTGSRMRRRSPRARVEYMDLSDPASAPAPPASED